MYTFLLAACLLPPAPPQARDRLEFEHSMLRGTWVIESMTENGEKIGKDLISEKFTRGGLVAFGNRMFRLVDPETGKYRDTAFRISPGETPKQMDIITKDDEVLQGIYKFDDEKLVACFRDQSYGVRPADFASEPGQNTLLFELKLLPRPREEAEKPEPPKVDAPTTEEVARSKDRQLTSMAVGTWLQNDGQGSVTVVLREDGTFTSTRSWTQPSKKLFVGTTTSAGRWSITDSTINARITGSTDKKSLDQVFSGKLQTVSPDSMTYTDLFGRL